MVPLGADNFEREDMSSTRSRLAAAAAAVGVGALLYARARRRRTPNTTEEEPKTTAEVARRVELSVLRKCRVAHRGARDHGGEVALVTNANFALGPTIFRNVSSPLARAVLTSKLSREPFWRDAAAQTIFKAFAQIPRAPDYAPPLLQFMNEDCDFAMEHADGSFMDHLQFCFEYAAAHFQSESPNVLLLHSVLGVGTNYFPCDASKIPKLKSLLTAREFSQVEAFPSLLRLIVRGAFLPALAAFEGPLASVELHRVIDNKRLVLSGDDLWTALNYQLVHLLDFLPAADWRAEIDKDLFLMNFAALHALLVAKGKLVARVDFDLAQALAPAPSPFAPDPKRLSLGDLIRDYVPSAIQAAIGKKEIAKYSRAIGHDLAFALKPPRSRDFHADGTAARSPSKKAAA